MVAIYARQSVDKKDSISVESLVECYKTKLLPDYEGIGIDDFMENRDYFSLEERKRIANVFIENVLVTDGQIAVKLN